MSMQKYTRAITGRIIGLVFTLSIAANCVYAADPITTSALDEIGQQYELNAGGDVFLSFDINNKETTVAFTVKPLGDKGDLALIYSGSAEDGVNSLICRLTAQCRGENLKTAIGSFINAAYAFSVAQQKNTQSATAPVASKSENPSQAATSSDVLDINAVPEQYRDSSSKVKAWLKQQGFFGKIVSIKVRVNNVGDDSLTCQFASARGVGPSDSFIIRTDNYSPLDFNKGEIYIATGQMEDNWMLLFELSSSTLKRAQ